MRWSKVAAGTPALRWVLVAAVLVLAAAVALWPRDSDQPEPAGPPPAAAPDQLASMRERAALRPCPEPVVGPQTSSGVLAGVRVPCLGAEGTVDLGAALRGKAALLTVWSHTCEPCREELPALDAYAALPGAVSVLGVQVDGSPQAGLGFLTALRVRLPSVADPAGAFRIAVSAPQVLPLNYVVAPNGEVRMVNPPIVFSAPDQVDPVVRRYLAEASQ